MDSKDLDRLFKGKLGEVSSPPDGAHWDQALVMIRAEKNKKKRDRWFFFLLIGILGTIHVGLIYRISLQKQDRITIEFRQTPAMAEKSKETPRVEEGNDGLGFDDLNSALKNGVVLDDPSGRTANSNHIYSDEDQEAKEPSSSSDFFSDSIQIYSPNLRQLPNPADWQERPPALDQDPVIVAKPENTSTSPNTRPEEALDPQLNPLYTDSQRVADDRSRIDVVSNLDSREPAKFDWIYALDQLERPHPRESIFAQAKYRETRLGWTGTLLLNPSISGASPLQGFVLGFAGEYHLSKDLYVGTKPSVQMRLNQDGFSKFQQLTTFAFEAVSTTYGLKTSSLQMISLPVYLGWRKGIHLIDVGGSADLLLAARGRLQQVDVNGQEVTAVESLNTGWLETNEMRTVSLNLSAGYRLALTNRFYTGMSIFYFPGKLYPGLPNSLNQNLKSKWHLGLQATYYIQ